MHSQGAMFLSRRSNPDAAERRKTKSAEPHEYECRTPKVRTVEATGSLRRWGRDTFEACELPGSTDDRLLLSTPRLALTPRDEEDAAPAGPPNARAREPACILLAAPAVVVDGLAASETVTGRNPELCASAERGREVRVGGGGGGITAVNEFGSRCTAAPLPERDVEGPGAGAAVWGCSVLRRPRVNAIMC